MAQHFLQVGTLDVDGERLQVRPVQRPEIREPERHSVGTCETAIPQSREPERHSVGTCETAIPQSSVIEASWSDTGLTEQLLMMYFENQKRSGGGPVKDLRFFAEERKAYIHFVDEQCELFSVMLNHSNKYFSIFSTHSTPWATTEDLRTCVFVPIV